MALVAGAVVAATRWPRINEVETGRTPEYPDLRDREYAAPEAAVAQGGEGGGRGRCRAGRCVGAGQRAAAARAVQALATTRPPLPKTR